MKQGFEEMLPSGKCLPHYRADLSSIPSKAVESEASWVVLVIPEWESEDKVLGSACLAEPVHFRLTTSLSQKLGRQCLTNDL